MLHTTRGLVLRRSRSGEADQYIQLLPEEGALVRLRVHGLLASRKRSALISEPGTLIEAVYYSKDGAGGSMRESRVLDRFEECKATYEATLVVSHLLEVVERATRGADTTGLFALLEGAMQTLRARAVDPREASGRREARRLVSFCAVRLARILGVLADTEACSNCGAILAERVAWMQPELSFHCPQCSDLANEEDALMARWSGWAARLRYDSFAERVPAGHPLLSEWQSRLLRAQEHFFSAGLRTTSELQRVLHEGA